MSKNIKDKFICFRNKSFDKNNKHFCLIVIFHFSWKRGWNWSVVFKRTPGENTELTAPLQPSSNLQIPILFWTRQRHTQNYGWALIQTVLPFWRNKTRHSNLTFKKTNTSWVKLCWKTLASSYHFCSKFCLSIRHFLFKSILTKYKPNNKHELNC